MDDIKSTKYSPDFYLKVFALYFSKIFAGRRIEAVTLSPNITEKTLEKGDNFSVTCQAPGHGTPGISYIKWYKQSSTGKHELHKPMVVRKGRSDTDIEILTIKNAMKGVEGTYICERQVLRGPITAAEFKLMFQGMRNNV